MKKITLMLLLSAPILLQAQAFTRGVGVYPGNPNEDFAPLMVPDSANYRNLALRRAAYHSSSYDYNLTATLVTDGIKETTMPRTIAVSTSQSGLLNRIDRELLLDDNVTSTIALTGAKVWVQFELRGGLAPLTIDRVEVVPRAGFGGVPGRGAQQPAQPPPGGWSCVVSGSEDGQSWKELGRTGGPERPMGQGFRPVVNLSAPSQNRFYRVELAGPDDTRWNLSEIFFFNRNQRVKIGGPYNFNSAWMSDGAGEQWIYVDLGASCTFDRVSVSWVRRPAEAVLQVSDNAKAWSTVQSLPSSAALTDDVKLTAPAKGRYVRILMNGATSEGTVLSEMEVWGRGGLVPKPAPQPAMDASGRLHLAGGAWRVQRASLVGDSGEAISQAGFQDRDWVVATVPATTLSSYFNVGAVPDANFGDNQLQISDSFFCADFWYRDEFTVPAFTKGKRFWLNFDGINWKADVYVNDGSVGRIEGGFMRGRFDVTERIKPGGRNALAVRIIANATPGSTKEKTAESTGLNGGALGADNPTYHATVGWDWIPPVRGRDAGIWADVYLTTTGPVTIENPFASSTLPLPDTSSADITIQATLRNTEPRPVSGTLRGSFGPAKFEMPLTLEASTQKIVQLDPSSHPALRLSKPRLWWPNGYGEQYRYPVTLEFLTDGKSISDRQSFLSGVRQFTYSEEGGNLRIWINGRRFIARGGNWGHPEANLRYRAREYDAAVRYHKDMNFTMIRNWVGQVGDEAFYEACDQNGIAVWQDFWLANPVDGPNPDDNDMFLRNARDFVLKIRKHPAVALYVGRNEGSPPPLIDQGIRALLSELHPGIHYIADSAAGVVSGHGPYWANPIAFYFQQRATPKLHSEMGMPNVMTIESIRLTIPEDRLWPPSTHVWGLHDFTTAGAQRGGGFRDIIDKKYGGASNIEEWATLAQFVNYDGYRAMFEAQSRNRMGLIIWMSHPSWPSFVWQTYDYFFEANGGYFGSKKGSEPLHIQWNAATDMIEVVNYNAGDKTGLTARVEVLNMDGTRKWERTATLSSKEDSVETPIKMEYPADLTPVHFLRLALTEGTRVVSTNFYLRGTSEYELPAAGGRGGQALKDFDLRAIRTLPKVRLQATTRTAQQGNRWILTTDLRNDSPNPAIMVRLKAVREKTGDRILPVLYEDNYISLMPGERRTIRTELENADTRGERPRMVIEGFNIAR